MELKKGWRTMNSNGNEKTERKLVKNEKYGMVFGKYTLLEHIEGTKKYVVRCNRCGYVNENGLRIADVRKTSAETMCNHKNFSNIEAEDRVGEVHGKFKIINCLNKRDSSRRMLYDVECVDCGRQFTNKSISKMNQTVAGTPCNHIIDPKEKIGEVHGKYEIIDYLGRNRFNQALFATKCLKCGYVNYKGTMLSDLDKSSMDDTGCNHYLTIDEIAQRLFEKEEKRHPDLKVVCVEIK